MQERWSVAEITETRLYDANGAKPASGGTFLTTQLQTTCALVSPHPTKSAKLVGSPDSVRGTSVTSDCLSPSTTTALWSTSRKFLNASAIIAPASKSSRYMDWDSERSTNRKIQKDLPHRTAHQETERTSQTAGSHQQVPGPWVGKGYWWRSWRLWQHYPH